MDDPNKYDNSQTDSRSNLSKGATFNRDLTPDEIRLARTAFSCAVQGVGLFSISGCLAYMGTGRFIAMQNIPFLKRSVPLRFFKFSVGLITANITAKFCNKACMKRIENLPPSEAKDKFFERLKSGRRGRLTPLDNDGSSNEPGRGATHIPSLQEGTRYASQPADSNNSPFEKTPNTPRDRRAVDFDYSKSPDETSVDGGGSKLNPRIRRNKYGDIVEEI